MKNYLDQKRELLVAKARLDSLREMRRVYFALTQPKGIDYSRIVVTGSGMHKDNLAWYVDKIREIDEQIDIVQDEIILLQSHLVVMEHHFRRMKGSLERVFVYRYIDGLTVNQIAQKMCYSESQIYRKLTQIEQVINKSCEKMREKE